jgi:uncharacterized protein YgfB (UPF0149 family)
MNMDDSNPAKRLHDAEARGALIGALAAGEPARKAAQLAASSASRELSERSPALAAAPLAALRNGHYVLQEPLADTRVSLALRVDMLAAWTRGFLSGLGQAGARLDAIGADGQEMLRDLDVISRGATLEPEDAGGDNEIAFGELLEYLGLAANYFFHELN